MRKSSRLQLRLSPEVKEYLELIARRECRTVSAQIEYWVLREKVADYQAAMEEAGEGK